MTFSGWQCSAAASSLASSCSGLTPGPHEIVKKRRTDIASRLNDLADLKQLTSVKLPGEDVFHLADIIMRVEETGLLAAENAVGVDSYGVAAITKALTREGQGIAAERIVGINQGWKLNGAIKDMERDLAGGQLVHSGLQLMEFCRRKCQDRAARQRDLDRQAGLRLGEDRPLDDGGAV